MSRPVETSAGLVRGGESEGVRSFKGLRFARAPRGALRFHPPLPPEPWAGIRDAVDFGPAAPQYALPWFGWISAAGTQPDDDCLSLNIWTPGTDGARRPVMVWIHGGGFMGGSGSTGTYHGHDLARRRDVVVVTVNYRLGPLGYAHLGSVLGEGFEDATNLGVRDQIAALEWIRDNIERFGGDPGNVTLFGQSAGSMSIAALLGSPRARALFHKAICMSGGADQVLEREEAARVANAFLRALGGPPQNPEAMGRIPMSEILRAQGRVMNEASDLRRMMVFVPMVDGDVITQQPLDAIRDGATRDMPLLIGSTLDEWRLFRLIDPGPRGMDEAGLVRRFDEAHAAFPGAPESPHALVDWRNAVAPRLDASDPTQVWSAFQSARMFHYPSAALADAQVEGGGAAHHYLFTWRPRTLRRTIGACHGLDIPFVFGSVSHPLVMSLAGFNPAVIGLSRRMQRAWASFASTGIPGHRRIPPWSDYTREQRHTMVFGWRTQLAHKPLEAERQLLETWSTA